MGRVLRLETSENNEFSKSVKFFWTFLEAQNRLHGAARGPRVFQSSSPELRSMSGRKESFWDGLGPEIDGGRPGFSRIGKTSPRAEGTFRSFHITPYSSLLEGGVGGLA